MLVGGWVGGWLMYPCRLLSIHLTYHGIERGGGEVHAKAPAAHLLNHGWASGAGAVGKEGANGPRGVADGFLHGVGGWVGGWGDELVGESTTDLVLDVIVEPGQAGEEEGEVGPPFPMKVARGKVAFDELAARQVGLMCFGVGGWVGGWVGWTGGLVDDVLKPTRSSERGWSPAPLSRWRGEEGGCLGRGRGCGTVFWVE